MVHDGKHYPKLKLTPVVTGTLKKSLIKKKKKKRKVFKRFVSGRYTYILPQTEIPGICKL